MPGRSCFQSVRSSSPKSPDGLLACDVIASPAKACAHVSISIARQPRPRSDGPCSLCGLQGRERSEGHFLQVHRRQSSDRRPAQVRAGDDSKLEFALGRQALLQPRAVRCGPEAHRAFYKDRGFPDARVSSFDVKLNKDQTAVKITVTVSEGKPIVVERIVFEGLEALPEQHRHSLEANLPLKQGQPLDRALLQASREATLDELKDHGFPYASVRLAEDPGSSDRQRVITLHAEPGALARFGPLDIEGNSSVSDRIIRRQLTFRPGRSTSRARCWTVSAGCTPGTVPVRERQVRHAGAGRRDSDEGHGQGRQAQEGELLASGTAARSARGRRSTGGT